jgi:uncharacterized protein (DUF1778 family)
MATVPAPTPTDAPRRARERIDVRLRPEQKALIEKAANIKGLTVTDFMVQIALENAQRTIRDYETWTLEQPDAELFAAVLAAPTSLGPRLVEASRRYKESLLQR